MYEWYAVRWSIGAWLSGFSWRQVGFVFRPSPAPNSQPSPPPISLLGRREVVPGWSRAYQLAPQECLHRVTTNQQPPPLPSIKDVQLCCFLSHLARFCWRGCVGSQSVCAQAAWKVQPVEDCWQATGARAPTSLQQICSDGSNCGSPCYNTIKSKG